MTNLVVTEECSPLKPLLALVANALTFHRDRSTYSQCHNARPMTRSLLTFKNLFLIATMPKGPPLMEDSGYERRVKMTVKDLGRENLPRVYSAQGSGPSQPLALLKLY